MDCSSAGAMNSYIAQARPHEKMVCESTRRVQWLPYYRRPTLSTMMSQEEKPLQLEYRYYLQIKPELLKQSKGKFALIKGERLVGAFDTDADAYKAGLLEFGNTPFLITQILEDGESTWVPILQLGLLNARNQ
jgi:hypothetical protein